MMAFKKLYYLERDIRTTLKAAKKETSAPDPSNAVINEKTSMPTINNDISTQAVLPAPTSSTSCTSAPVKTFKKYQDKDFADIVDDAEIWAVYPGISTIFTAVDSTEHKRIRTTSLEEYYHLCGYNLAIRR
ncbi:hypothetical protein RMCBS344292_12672 [Rhizopus microsporus]|nr:hypothetical protein RMCBS344292_12672 [Rhizopus microsporus]